MHTINFFLCLLKFVMVLIITILIRTLVSFIGFYICGYLFNNQILFSNNFSLLTFNYFTVAKTMIFSLAFLDPLGYVIGMYLIPKYYQQTKSVKDTIILYVIGKEKINNIVLFWLIMIVFIFISYYFEGEIPNYLGIFAAFLIPILLFFTVFFIICKVQASKKSKDI